MKLTSKQNIDLLFSTGKNYSCPLFRSKYLNADQKFTAVVVTKKVAKRSVDRNRIKRRLLSAYRSTDPLPQKVVFLPNIEVLNCDYALLRQQLLDFTRQSKP